MAQHKSDSVTESFLPFFDKNQFCTVQSMCLGHLMILDHYHQGFINRDVTKYGQNFLKYVFLFQGQSFLKTRDLYQKFLQMSPLCINSLLHTCLHNLKWSLPTFAYLVLLSRISPKSHGHASVHNCLCFVNKPYEFLSYYCIGKLRSVDWFLGRQVTFLDLDIWQAISSAASSLLNSIRPSPIIKQS